MRTLLYVAITISRCPPDQASINRTAYGSREVAGVLGVSTVTLAWHAARAWLFRRLTMKPGQETQ
jgi:hypothetical protein